MARFSDGMAYPNTIELPSGTSFSTGSFGTSTRRDTQSLRSQPQLGSTAIYTSNSTQHSPRGSVYIASSRSRRNEYDLRSVRNPVAKSYLDPDPYATSASSSSNGNLPTLRTSVPKNGRTVYESLKEALQNPGCLPTLPFGQDYTKRDALQKELESLENEEALQSICTAMMSNRTEIDCVDWDLWTALHYAASCGLSMATKWLLQNGANIHLRTHIQSHQPLHKAAIGGHEEVILLLLNQGASVNGRVPTNGVNSVFSPVELAVQSGHERSVHLLLERSNAISSSPNIGAALRFAAAKGHICMVQLFLESGADPSAKTDEGWTGLHSACQEGNLGIAQSLLAHGANVNVEYVDGATVEQRTALAIAEKRGHDRIVLELLRHGATPRYATGSKKASQFEPRRSPSHSSDSASVASSHTGQSDWSKLTLVRRPKKSHLTNQNEVLTTASHQPQDSNEGNFPLNPQQELLRNGCPCSPMSLNETDRRQSQSSEELHRPTTAVSIDSIPSISQSSYRGSGLQEAVDMDARASISTISPESSISGSVMSNDSYEDIFLAQAFRRQQLLETLMKGFYALIFPRRAIAAYGTVSHGDGSTSARSLEGEYQGNALTNSSQGDTGKNSHKRPIDEEDVPSGDDDDGDRKRQKQNAETQGVTEPVHKYACPFFKYDPKTYCKIGSCTGPGFTTVSRVKEHLYRRHKPPIQCSRCGTEFQRDEELENHQRMKVQCELKEKAPYSRVTPRKMELIRSKRRYSDDPGDDGRWRDIFRILFPGAEVPCPYYEPPMRITEDQSSQSQLSQDAETFHDYAQQHLPLLVEAKIESAIQERFHPLEQELRTGIGETVRSSLSELFQTWQSTKMSTLQLGKDAPRKDSLEISNPENIPGLAGLNENTDKDSQPILWQPQPRPPVPIFSLDEVLDDSNQSHSFLDSMDDSGYGSYSEPVRESYEPYSCICDEPFDGVIVPTFDEGVALCHITSADPSHEPWILTGSDETVLSSSVASADQPVSVDCKADDKGKVKAVDDDFVDPQLRFCGRCGGGIEHMMG